MRDAATIVYGVAGQSLVLRGTVGAVASATFAVFDDSASDDATPEFSGTATLDTVGTTTSAAAGSSQANPQRLPLTSSAGVVVGRRYLLSQVALREWVEPIEVGTGYILVRHPLKNDYATAATLIGTTTLAAVPDVWAADLANISDPRDPAPAYRCKWSLVVGGVTSIVYSFFDVARTAQGHDVDIEDINARAPGLDDGLPTEYRVDQGRPLIEAAWRAVRLDVAGAGLDVDAIHNAEVIDELVILRCLRLLAEGGWRPLNMDSVTYLQLTTANYDRFFEKHVIAITRLASDASGATQAASAPPFWMK